jgi:hypothetical protein
MLELTADYGLGEIEEADDRRSPTKGAEWEILLWLRKRSGVRLCHSLELSREFPVSYL